MKCKNIILSLCILLGVSNSLIAQLWQAPKIEIGLSNRGTTYTLGDGRENRYILTSINSSIAFVGVPKSPSNWFSLGITEKLPGENKITISLTNYVSLQKQYAIKKVVTDGNNAYALRTKRDHFIDIYNSFGKEKRKIRPFLGIGFGLINCGTDFKILPTGPLASISSPIIGTDRSSAFRFHAGLQLKPLKASVIANLIGKENLGYAKINVEAKLSYTISPFAKGKQIMDFPKIKIFKTRLPIINVGIALRTKNIIIESPGPYNFPTKGKYYPAHEATPRLFVDISKKLAGRNNLYVTLSNYITYANIGGDNKVNKFKRDHFLDITNHFKTKKENTKFLLGAGMGLMNCGTNYSYIRTYTNNGIIYTSLNPEKTSQRFSTLRLIMGIQKNAFSASIISHATSNGYEEKEGGPAVWLEAKFGYNLLAFGKKK